MSGSDVKVSVVVCTYNGEKYLREQLQSIRDQTWPPDEIIISDDGSTDSTLEIIEDFALSSNGPHPPVWRVEKRTKPSGVSGNFASALGEVRGEFIALADQDDVWEPDRLEKGLAHFHYGALLVHSDATLISGSGLPTGTLMSALRLTSREKRNLLSGRALRALLRRNVVTGATTMIRSSLLEQALPIPEGWVHDEWLALVAAVQGGVVFQEDLLIRYRQHGNNQIGASKAGYEEATRRLREKRSEFFARKLRRNDGIVALLANKPVWLDSVAHSSLAAKVEFDQWRSTLPSSRVRRLVPVLRRWFTGHYGHYARGYLDVIRDIALID